MIGYLIFIIVTALIVLASVWLGVCIGARHVSRTEGSEFLTPMQASGGAKKLAEFAGEQQE